MRNWITQLWRDYVESFDPDANLAGSSPAVTLTVAGSLIVVFLSLAYVPAFAAVSQFDEVWIPVALVVVATVLTLMSWHRGCRGTFAHIAQLFDISLYSAAIAFAAYSSAGSVALALAVVHALVLALFPGQYYAFSVLIVSAIATPLVGLMVLLRPPLPIVLITVGGTLAMVVLLLSTRNQREFARRQRNLEQALGAADEIADESVQAALTTTLLTLGHFLHELSNYQTAISTNLDFVRLRAKLSEDAAKALEEAQAAQREQEELLRSTIADLRGRARPERTTFRLSRVLRRAADEMSALEVTIAGLDFDLEVRGNSEHLRVVLLNLLRNAEQAAARRVRVDARLEPSGQAVRLMVHNDGRGIAEEDCEKLFDSFGVSTKRGGSGLGLYLVRRYVELLGGRIGVQTGPLGGAAFVIRLPGRVIAQPQFGNALDAS